MAKQQPQPPELNDDFDLPVRRGRGYWRWLGTALVLAAVMVGSFELVYYHKVYSGVSADGLDLGGLSRVAAKAKLADHLAEFSGDTLSVTYGDRTLQVPVNDLAVSYDADRVINLAYSYGRTGSWDQRIMQQLRALLGRPTAFAAYTYSDDRLQPYISDISDDVVTPVTDAGLSFSGQQAQVTPAQTGGRLDMGRLALLVANRLSRTSADTIVAPVYQLSPLVTTDQLQAAAAQANQYLAGPLTLTYGTTVKEVAPAQIVSWITINRMSSSAFMNSLKLTDLYPMPTKITLGISKDAVAAYVADLASKVDVSPRNAMLKVDSGNIAIDQPSQVGSQLDQTGAVKAILQGLTKPADQRNLDLSLTTVQPDVSETNLPNLGIKELISEGVSTFPGSTSARLTNVRVGASKFNGVLLKPGQVFSFGALLGDVGPAQGYKPELVILGDHEEKQYGGGLCQVSSTAFRAALNAGLPIVERHNHSFAISYYTQPYGVPGVDATIFYPQVDFKFKNDTTSYILIQTEMQGTNLKFSFYGTKAKTGTIRGPQFISGSLDHTKPSRTVFYRDVVDLTGKVTKTDTFYSNYQSSNDFPVQKQFNN